MADSQLKLWKPKVGKTKINGNLSFIQEVTVLRISVIEHYELKVISFLQPLNCVLVKIYPEKSSMAINKF